MTGPGPGPIFCLTHETTRQVAREAFAWERGAPLGQRAAGLVCVQPTCTTRGIEHRSRCAQLGALEKQRFHSAKRQEVRCSSVTPRRKFFQKNSAAAHLHLPRCGALPRALWAAPMAAAEPAARATGEDPAAPDVSPMRLFAHPTPAHAPTARAGHLLPNGNMIRARTRHPARTRVRRNPPP